MALGNPEEFGKNRIQLQVGEMIPRNRLLFGLVDILYNRTEAEFKRGTFVLRETR